MTPELHCPNCPSANVIFSKKRGAFVCEDCGHVLNEETVAPLRIFFSYGHDANEELVRRIKTDLEKRGHEVWFDKHEIECGDDWRRAITDGITGSHRVLSFLSKHSTRDPGVCLDEIAIAIGVKGGNIQTILVESEMDVKPPASISHNPTLRTGLVERSRGSQP
ncbi:MAG TPA: TIR domain-containing protein [Verrucomicrobiae bacterium]